MKPDRALRIGMMIGGLGTGGTERQLIRLARAMADRGHTVGVWLYGASTSDPRLDVAGITVRTGNSRSWREKIRATRAWYEEFRPDLVHGFMKRASSLAVLASPVRRGFTILGSDLSTATYARGRLILWPSLAAFRLADGVVTQTDLNRRSLERLAPWLRGRVHVVRNGVDTQSFAPRAGPTGPRSEPLFRFACVGTVYELKNPVRMVRAIAELRDAGVPPFHVDWYGRMGLTGDHEPSAAFREAKALTGTLDVEDLITFHGETRPIQPAYHGADALIHPSIQEGFPNAVVEGMACGLPVVVGRVSDLPLVVEGARNGYVFDESDPSSIADSMARMIRTSAAERQAMGERSRELAVDWFGMERFVDEFEALYRRLIANRR